MSTFRRRQMIAAAQGGGSDIPVGALKGKFTINANGDQVYFSKGNLQYIGSASTPYWKFAENQWDYLGTTTGQNSDSQNVDRDLFGWGTSNYNHGAVCYQPWSVSQSTTDYFAYGMKFKNLTDESGKANWGYNIISNGGNTENSGWRCTNHLEFEFLVFTRKTQSGSRYVYANLNGIKGLVILPDDWDNNYYNFTNINTSGDFVNTLTLSQWSIVESYGAVFMPLSGNRNGTGINASFLNNYGWYWCNDYFNNNARFIDIRKNYFTTSQTSRYIGYAVRLVKDIIA